MVTQDVADVLGTDLGQAVVANAATQVLLKQAPQAIDAVADAFGLTAGERRMLLTARIGPRPADLRHATGPAFEAVASPAEHAAGHHRLPPTWPPRRRRATAPRSTAATAPPPIPGPARRRRRTFRERPREPPTAVLVPPPLTPSADPAHRRVPPS